jgi:hypothetical protein
MALPQKIQENMMNLFAASYLGFHDEQKMELGINEFHMTIGKEIDGWQDKLRQVLVSRGADEQQMTVYDRYVKKFGGYEA